MENPLQLKIGEWFFACRPCRNDSVHKFIAWCAKIPDLTDGPLEVASEADVYVQFGEMAEDALDLLKKEVLQ